MTTLLTRIPNFRDSLRLLNILMAMADVMNLTCPVIYNDHKGRGHVWSRLPCTLIAVKGRNTPRGCLHGIIYGRVLLRTRGLAPFKQLTTHHNYIAFALPTKTPDRFGFSVSLHILRTRPCTSRRVPISSGVPWHGLRRHRVSGEEVAVDPLGKSRHTAPRGHICHTLYVTRFVCVPSPRKTIS